MDYSRFKEGDIVTILKGRKSSRELILDQVKALKIIKIYPKEYYDKCPKVDVILVEGTILSYHGRQRPSMQKYCVFIDCLEKDPNYIPEGVDYDIF